MAMGHGAPLSGKHDAQVVYKKDLAAAKKELLQVGPGESFLPRHTHRFRPSFLESNVIL